MKPALLATLVLVAGTGVAFAHPGHDNAGLVAGFLHPLTGMDHLLAMIAVGLLAVTAGSRLALVAMPAAFVATMAVGAAFGAVGYGTPWTENLVAGSLVVLGALVAWARPLPLAAIVALVSHAAAVPGSWFGAHDRACLTMGLILGLLMAGTLTAWLRRGAPVAPEMAGLLVGIASGCTGMFAFAFYCPSNSLYHVGVWHTVPIVLSALLGRLVIPPLVRW